MKRVRAGLRWVAPLVMGTAMAALIAAGALALQTTLSRPSSADVLAVKVVLKLERIMSIGSDQRLTGVARVHASCRAHGRRDTVLLSDGRRFVVDLGGVKETRGKWRSPLVIDAESRLAGCPRLLVGGISRRLFAGKRVIDGRLVFDGVAAYRIRVDSQPPTVYLIVSRRDFTPLAIRLRLGGRFNGASRLTDVRLAPVVQAGNIVQGALPPAQSSR